MCVTEGEGGVQKALFCQFLFFDVALLVGGRGVVGWGRKSYLGPAELSSFSSRDLSRRNKHDSLGLVVAAGCFYILFLWAIAAFNFPPLEIHWYVVLLLSSITFTANSQADNHSIYIFICFFCFKYYTVMFYGKNRKWSIWYIPNGLQKKLFIEKNRFFSVDYVKINELHVVHTWRHMQSE